jgi:hypothetical protein
LVAINKVLKEAAVAEIDIMSQIVSTDTEKVRRIIYYWNLNNHSDYFVCVCVCVCVCIYYYLR